MVGTVVGSWHAYRSVLDIAVFVEPAALPDLPGTWARDPFARRAIEFLTRRQLLTPDEFVRLSSSARLAGFTFAGATSKTMVRTAQRSVAKSMRAGASVDLAAIELNATLVRAGYSPLNPWHAALVSRQAYATSYGAASWQALHDPRIAALVPMFRYVTLDDGRVRASHLALHNKFFRRDDPIWNTIWPPNGFNCRCFVRGVTVNMVRTYGLRADRKPRAGVPDEGFDSNPSQAIQRAVSTGRRK